MSEKLKWLPKQYFFLITIHVVFLACTFLTWTIVCLFVFERRPRIGFHHLRWTNGRQSRITLTQVTVLRGLWAFLSSHLTTLCCAILPNRYTKLSVTLDFQTIHNICTEKIWQKTCKIYDFITDYRQQNCIDYECQLVID